MKPTLEELTEDIDLWLQHPVDGFSTMEESINCDLAETGTDMESDFDLETEQTTRYEIWLDQVNS